MMHGMLIRLKFLNDDDAPSVGHLEDGLDDNIFMAMLRALFLFPRGGGGGFDEILVLVFQEDHSSAFMSIVLLG
jgi:hypothetical protein